MNRITEFVESQNFYAALKSLDELQNIQLQEIESYEFVVLTRASIPTIKALIQDAVMKRLKEWLFDVRRNSRSVGFAAFQNTETRRKSWKARQEENHVLKFARLNSAIELVLNEEDSFDALVKENGLPRIDFTILYECMHIYDELGSSDKFQSSYQHDRRTQKDLLLPPSLSIVNEDLSSLQTLLQDITGFAIIEHFTLHKTAGFRDPDEVERIWSSICSKLVDLVKTACSNVRNPNLILKMKGTLIIFVQTLEAYGFDMKVINGFMLALFEQYSDALERRFSENFKGIADEDIYLPMSVESYDDWQKIASYCWYRSPSDPPSVSYPAIFPFSQIYPLCCIEIRNFINEFYLFSDDITRSEDVDELLRKSLDDLLINHVNETLSKRLANQQLEQVVQMIINLENFENACEELNRILSDSRSSKSSTLQGLRASSIFGDTRKQAEKRIFEMVNTKIDEFLDLSDYDWSTPVRRAEPAPYIQEMAAFLTTVINSKLINLPYNIKTFVYFDALDHLATRLLQILINPSTKKISTSGIENFDVDIKFLERFVEGLDDQSIASADVFLEIRQCVNLLTNARFSEYLNTGIRLRNYSRVKAGTAQVLLEKVLASSSIMSLNAQERIKRRSIESTLSALRNAR